MTEASIETNGVIVTKHGYRVQIHRDDRVHGTENLWTFRIDNPTVYNVVPKYGYIPRFADMDSAVKAAERYLDYQHEFITTIKAAQKKMEDQLNEFDTFDNPTREKQPYEAVNG